MTAAIRGLAALLLAAACALPAVADYSVEVTFSRGEIETIRAWYREHEAGEKHGKQRRKGLPPGIAKNLARGKPLPPGIAKQTLPTALIERLPPPPDGYERIIIDGKVLLVEIATQIVHDVLADVILD